MGIFNYIAIWFTVEYLCLGVNGALKCYTCTNIQHAGDCANTTRCLDNQSCFANVTSLRFALGCVNNQQCGKFPSMTTSLVGRSLEDEEEQLLDYYSLNLEDHKMTRDAIIISERDTEDCFECCSSDICNINLCKHLKPTACIDDPKIDCALMNSKFGICQNVHEAKTVCPSFCGLCHLVDGSWADWSAWSKCDVTCASGYQTRFRLCTDPTPIYGGLDCPGDGNQTRPCTISPCPVDGNWSFWTSWSDCDVTCANGTQTRTRTCTNPVPAYSGQNCAGDSVDTNICVKEPCPIHGGWTQWFSWESCSVTCGVGVQRRHRNCSNPVPDHFGDHCFGDTMDDRICSLEPCAVSPTVAFRTKYLGNTSLSANETFVFNTTSLNVGNGYNNQTGKFTAPFQGSYLFSFQLCIASNNRAYYAVMKNDEDIERGLYSSSTETCQSQSITVNLNVSDTLWLSCSRQSCHFIEDTYYWNTFSGHLIII